MKDYKVENAINFKDEMMNYLKILSKKQLSPKNEQLKRYNETFPFFRH